MLVEPHLAFDALADLLSPAEVEALASRALALAIDNFGARAGSLFYDRRPPLRLRHGDLASIHHTTIDHWEKNVQKRLTSGSWTVAPGQESLLASRPVPGTDDLALYGLVLDEREVRGTICLIFPQDRAPGGRTLAALSGYLRFVANAVRMAVQLALTTERLGQLSLFYQVAQSMASTLDVSTVLENSMQLATAVLDASVSALMLVDEEKKELVFEYAYGPMSSVLRKQRTGFNEGIAGWVANHGIPVVVNDARTDPRFSPAVDARTGFLTQSVVCAPIQIRGETLGVLEALNKRGEQGFDSEDLRLMVTTANQAAVAIENARLYESLREERDRIIEAQENVRRQVARNLHDGTVQFLSAIAMGVDHLERLVEFKPEDAKSELASLRRLTRQASQQARLALFELRPVILETQGLLPALGAYAEQLRGNELFAVHLEAPESSARDPRAGGSQHFCRRTRGGQQRQKARLRARRVVAAVRGQRRAQGCCGGQWLRFRPGGGAAPLRSTGEHWFAQHAGASRVDRRPVGDPIQDRAPEQGNACAVARSPVRPVTTEKKG